MVSLLRGCLGIFTITVIAWLLSVNRRRIDWKTVCIAFLSQFILAVVVVYVPFVSVCFEYISRFFVKILECTREGMIFLFGDYLLGISPDSPTALRHVFALHSLPVLVFFSALTSLLYYFGIIQKVVCFFSLCLRKIMKISGAEGLTVAGNIFLGQTEAPLLIKKYLPQMNRSEIFLVMTAGMGTIAGTVLAAYIGMLGGNDLQAQIMFGKHLLSASVMAAPGAIAIAKILFPQTEKIDENVEITKDSVGNNWLDAICNGTGEGLRLAVNVAAQLLVFIALIALINVVLKFAGGIGDNFLNNFVARISGGQFDLLSLQSIFGLVFMPIAWLMGICFDDAMLAGNLLGEKMILNEFIGYIDLARLKEIFAFTEEKTVIMATYFLCGFANIGSVGVLIGGIGSMAPTKKKWLASDGLKAMIGGTLVSCMSATMIGIII